MKRLILVLPVMAVVGCTSRQEAPRAIGTEDEKTLHAVGLVLAQNLEVFQLSPEELERVIDGIRAGVSGRPGVKLADYQAKADALASARMARTAEKRKTSDAMVAAELARDPRAQKEASGLVYVPIVTGTGPSPVASDTLRVHYRGRLTDGTEFDSSFSRGQPIDVTLDSVIPCWTEALKKMRVGGKAKIACPSSIAYGDAGHPPGIPGGSTLLFEIEVLGIVR